jgi:alkylhydroperoxidase family enzyme
VGRKVGLSQRQILEISDYASSNAFTAEERDILTFADCLTATPAEVPDALFNRLRAALSEPATIEVTAAIAWENYRARFNRAFNIDSQGFSDNDFCALPVRNTTKR